MRNLREPIQSWSVQTPIDQQRIMVAYECEGYHANGWKQPRSKDRKTFALVAFEGRWDLRPFDENRGDDNDHANEGETGSAGELVDIPVERKGVGDGYGAQGDYELPVCEQREDRFGGDRWKYRAYHMGYSVSYRYRTVM